MSVWLFYHSPNYATIVQECKEEGTTNFYTHRTQGWIWSCGCVCCVYVACWVRKLSASHASCNCCKPTPSLLGNYLHCSLTQTHSLELSSGIKFKLSLWIFKSICILRDILLKDLKSTQPLSKRINITHTLVASLTDLDGFRKAIKKEDCVRALETFEKLFCPQLHRAFQRSLFSGLSLQRQEQHIIPEG